MFVVRLVVPGSVPTYKVEEFDVQGTFYEPELQRVTTRCGASKKYLNDGAINGTCSGKGCPANTTVGSDGKIWRDDQNDLR